MKPSMKTLKLLHSLSLLLILTLSAGCEQSGIEGKTPSPTMSVSPTETIKPALTTMPLTPTRRATRIPPTAAAGVPVTWTPLPTYPPEQARQILMDLYENNPCRLPCWWGITPGKTSWLDAWQFLGRFATNRYPGDMLLLESRKFPGYMNFVVSLDIPQPPEEKYHLLADRMYFDINIKTFNVDYIDVNTGNIEGYTLRRILADYGKPQEVYALGEETQISSGVALFLFYPQDGFLSSQIVYVDRNTWKQSTAKVCFQDVTTNLSLWPPEEQLDFHSRITTGGQGIDSFTLSMIKPLHEVSNLDVNQFYRKFVDKKQPPCIEFNVETLQR